jgi:peptide/nickel transport system substrate-binding protein
MTVNLKHGIHWQNKAPMNGREFVADDVVAHYDRMLGTGHGYTEPIAMFGGAFANLQNVTATDDYTVVFHFKTPCAAIAFQTLADRAVYNTIEAPEVAAASGGSVTDWTAVVGTGPWMLTGYVSGTSVTFSRNPDYWGTDPRYPENQLPYADTFVLLTIPDINAEIAALRTGQVDLTDSSLNLTWQQAASIQETDPEIEWAKLPAGANGVSFRLDMAPFTDIRVRQALNMAIDRQSLADDYYGGTTTVTPVGLISTSFNGYAYAYADWSQELKDEYAYNVEGAQQLLAEAAADGVFTPNAQGGFDTNVLASNSGDLQLLQVFQTYFAAIGVNMEINAVDWATYEAMYRASEHDQMVTFGGASAWPPTRTMSQFYSGGSDNGATKVNDAGYDAIYAEFQAATTAEEAAQTVQAADKYIIEHFWAVWAPESYTFVFWQPYLKGYSGESLQWARGLTYARLWIDQALKTSMGR